MAGSLQSYRILALDVTPKLRVLTRGLAKTVTEPTARTFLKDLAFELLLIQDWLEDMPESPTITKDDLLKLLRNYERMCIYPSNLRKSNAPSQFFPTLRALYTADTISIRRAVSTALQKLACDEGQACQRHRQKLLVILKSFAQDKSLNVPRMVLDINDTNNEDPSACEDASIFIAALYRAFVSRLFCLQAASDQSVPITSRVALSGLDKINDSSLDFEVLFQAHPHADFVWQDACISVLKSPQVGFEGDIQNNPATSKRVNSDPVHEHEICRLVNVEEQVKLALSVHHDQLKFVGVRKRDTSGTVMNIPSTSLATVLSKQGLTPSMRLLLSITLAKAVWQFYNSDWMTQNWSKEHIHFMYTYSKDVSGGLLYASKPFLSAQSDEQQPPVSTRCRIHQFPKILALGIMLLEIELDVTIESQRRPEYCRPDGTPNINTDYTTADDLYNNTQLWADRCTYEPHKAVIGDCLTGKKFEPCVNADEEREALFDHVVKPLQNLWNVLWPTLDGTSLGPMKLAPKILTDITSNKECQGGRTQHGNTAATAEVKYDTDQTTYVGGDKRHDNIHQQNSFVDRQFSSDSPIHSGLAIAADKWFDRVENTCNLLRKKRRLGGYKRVRIAILDTGIHDNHPHRRRISGWKDFVTKGNNVAIDKTGHGTNSVDLIWRILPDADVYVARVFETDKAGVRTPELMAKAINHAIAKDWDVDIITISAGFENDSLTDEQHNEIKKAVLAANASNVLVFAAASNYGNLGRITSPANIDGNVICMFSSSGLAKQSAAFNPSASETSRPNFCILGEMVRSFQTSAVSEVKRSSGTSVATSVAAGIAALVIDFSRQADCKLNIPNKDKLKSFAGMRAIFKQMAVDGQDNDYNCISPWKLLDCPAASSQEWDDDMKRKHICSKIYNALLST